MNLYDPLLERDEAGIRAAIREFRRTHTSDELFATIARFAVLAYAPSQHAKHAVICCLSAYELREELGDRFDDLLTECAIYAASSRQPWSEPPITDPPALDDDQRGDVDELRESIAASERLRAERWLAKRYRDPEFAHDFFTVAVDDFEDLGHKLIVAVTAWKLATIFPSYATLRIGIWEMAAYQGERYEETGVALDHETLRARLIDNMVASGGDIISAHTLFLFDAALETKDAGVIRRVCDYLTNSVGPALSGHEGLKPVPTQAPIYRLARDCGAYLKSFVVAKRLRDARIVSASKYNLDHAPSFEEFSFA